MTSEELSDVLVRLTTVVVDEARQNPGFAARLSDVLAVGAPAPAPARPKRGRRAPGPWDPYAVYADVGEVGLRERLGQLELEQLKNIVAEHGMNNDGLASKWRKADRFVDRITERVVARSAKGDAFRSA